MMLLLLKAVATILAGIVCLRSLQVISRMDVRNRSAHYLRWFGYGLSQAALTCASVGSVLALWSDQLVVGDLVWITAVAGAIACDRREPRKVW